MNNIREDTYSENRNRLVPLTAADAHHSLLIQLDGAKRQSNIHEQLMVSSQVLLRTSKDRSTYLIELVQPPNQLSNQPDTVMVGGHTIHELSQIKSLQKFSVNESHYVILHPSSFYIRSNQDDAVLCGEPNQYHKELLRQYPEFKTSLCDASLASSPTLKNSTRFRYRSLLLVIVCLACLGFILSRVMSHTSDTDSESLGGTDGGNIAASTSINSVSDPSPAIVPQPVAQTHDQPPPTQPAAATANRHESDHLPKSESKAGPLEPDQSGNKSLAPAKTQPARKPQSNSTKMNSWKKQEMLNAITSYALEASFDPERARNRLILLKQSTKDPEIISKINDSLLQMGYQP